ncbi:ferritin-like domain-containing protein [Sphingobium fluviale]|uniref:Ferritin-like domain-containing protein n=1 Tax=Sphingobium fluviale TaxID=2506423 RepID=A0A4Q1KHK8_9SPHN|nr:ferritin-like domain-containing protein [Sphingobium fluviale]RXR29243.1 ferritin-like domain-containing protein [Sphingobium fluviale]
MIAALRRRYLDILGSIYIFNEHRGYSSLDRVLEAVRRRHPEATAFIAAVEKHRADEEKHYHMFRRYFEHLGYMPYAADKTCAHIDKMIRLTFGCDIDALDTDAVVASEAMFNRLCRVIILTEKRGMWQVDKLLNMGVIRRERALYQLFKVVERDEPSHWMPYDAWLRAHGGWQPTLGERLADAFVHKSLILWKLPLLFLNPWLKRRTDWQHEHDSIPLKGQPASQAFALQ